VFSNSETITFPSNAPVTVPTNSPLASPTNAPAPGPSILVYIIIKTDYYPGDTSFKVTNQDGIEFMSGGDYTASLTQYIASASLPNSNVYKFTIYDSYGDGICCTYGYGGYNLFVNGALIKAGGVFINSETTTLSTSSFDSFEVHKEYPKPKFIEPNYEKSKIENSNSIAKDTKKIRKERVNDGGER